MNEQDMKTLFSSESCEWATPQDFFNKMNELYGPFDLDVCATAANAKCAKYYTKEDNALVQDWVKDGPVCWMNPPYGKTIRDWMKKAYEESQRGATVVCLVHARTDTKWFHDFAIKGDLTFVKGRLKFGGMKNSCPFPSVVVVFRFFPSP